PGFGKSVSHSHRRTSRRWDPNVQTVHVVARPGGNKQRLNVCTSCIKAGKVVRG
ncbi:50S ribosomal protein L28, partial [Mycobacterium colombiense]